MKFRSNRSVAVGEAMIEMAPVNSGTYQRGFAGDTFNTAWHMSQILGPKFPVGFVSKVGTDGMSDAFVDLLLREGIETSAIERVADRTMGLYLIALNGVERSFQYWRGNSAARLLAADEEWLHNALDGAGLVHLSGITLAILSPGARHRLWWALKTVRAQGTHVSFDPNIRPGLWSCTNDIQPTVLRFLEQTDIALPSFDDEQSLWGDKSPTETIQRVTAAGVHEIVVKNGSGAVTAAADGHQISVETPTVDGIQDTSGAGDAFNAGYLAARLRGHNQNAAITFGQRVSGEVIQHFGARMPKGSVPNLL